jgi:hypothetical protein
LEIFFHVTTTRQGRSAAFNGGCVGLHGADPIKVQRHTVIAWLVNLRQLGRVQRGLGGLHLGSFPRGISLSYLCGDAKF